MSALAEASKLFFESVPAVGPATDKVSGISALFAPRRFPLRPRSHPALTLPFFHSHLL